MTTFSGVNKVEFSSPEDIKQNIWLIKRAFHGDIGAVQSASKSRIDAGVILPLQVGHKLLPLHLTPLFAAAIAGEAHVVKNLKDRGASAKSESGESLFTWTCLCPDKGKRNEVLKYVDAPKEYKAYLLGDRRQPVMTALRNSSGHPLTPFNMFVLADVALDPDLSVEDTQLIRSSKFREMRSLELTTYRIAIYELLKTRGMDVEEYRLNRFIIALQLGDCEGVREEVNHAVETRGITAREFLLADLGRLPPGIAAKRKESEIDRELVRHLGFGPACPPMYLAVRYGHIEILKFFNECGADLSARVDSESDRGYGYTPALLAAQYGQVEVLKCLKECGVSLSAPHPTSALIPYQFQGATPLSLAVYFGQVEVVKYLLSCRVDLTAHLNSGCFKGCPLEYLAIEKGYLEVLKCLRSETGVDFSSPITFGFLKGSSLAAIAAQNGRVEILKYMKDCGVDLSAPLAEDFNENRTLGYLAARGDQIALQKLFQGPGSNLPTPPTFSPYRNWTLARVAAEYGKVEVLKYFAEVGMDLSSVPLDVIFQGNYKESIKLELMQMLIQNGHNRILVLEEVCDKMGYAAYFELLSEEEKQLESDLKDEEHFLAKVLSGMTTFPDAGYIQWSQGRAIIRSEGDEIPILLFSGLTSLFSKDEDGSLIPHTIRNKGKERLKYQKQMKKRLSYDPIDVEKCDQLCEILQRIEGYSTGITRNQMLSNFPLEPIQVKWMGKGESGEEN